MYRVGTWRKKGEGHAFSNSVKRRVYYFFKSSAGESLVI
jgi:hypothetical protein